MPSLNRDHRRLLENTVAQARTIAVDGARKVLADQYAVHHHEPWPHMTPEERELRNQLRAHGRQLGDRRDERRDTQEIEHLVQACAYEHWHRMLFARFLAENDLLLDADHGMSMSLDEVRELAREQNRDWLEIAAELAQKMLLAVFRPDDPVLRVSLPPETRQELEDKLEALPAKVFRADDSLGWVYQFWQRDEKDRVNKSEVKIGADELPAVTQLFTEDYMVLFLLENTLGAWWTAKRRAEGNDPGLPGYEWTYLRLNDDGTPAAGGFADWPRASRDLRVLDPSMGSGHFLTFALPILARMRVEEEGLPLKEAIVSVLNDNLFGLEIDPRCAQIAAFNLALAAWRVAGEHFSLGSLNLACSGLGINATEADWVDLAGTDFRVREAMRRLYSLFRDAPALGSLIDPLRLQADLLSAAVEEALPLLDKALQKELSSFGHRELAIAAKGLLLSCRTLAGSYHLVGTNVPYLGQRKQDETLSRYCEQFHSRAKQDLATCFVERCLRLCAPGGVSALVTPQNWLFLSSYKSLREYLLTNATIQIIAVLGPGAFQTISGEVVNIATSIISASRPRTHSEFLHLDLSQARAIETKVDRLRKQLGKRLIQSSQLRNPDCRITGETSGSGPLLESFTISPQGIKTGDDPRWRRCFWEFDPVPGGWQFYQSPVEDNIPYGGREHVIDWRTNGDGMVRPRVENLAVGKQGVGISAVGQLVATLYSGERYDSGVATIVPLNPKHLPAIWTYCSSAEFKAAVRQIDKKVAVTNMTLVKVPFDLAAWESKAAQRYPSGLPAPSSSHPSQWLFGGHPVGSDHPLHVAVARLVGYRWPRQTGYSFFDCPSLAADSLTRDVDADGIVPLAGVAGEASAGDRLRNLLADAFGKEWSASRLAEMLIGCESLEVWLKERFFAEHCDLFHDRPFIWHVSDGRKDGFHALVNYHKLAGPNGEGRKTLEKLIYTYLGRWIDRQSDQIRTGKEGADARLAAALHLKGELEKILAGESPYDIFVRWKPIHEQAIGWAPDINDGVRVNIRPWLLAKPYQAGRRDGCILRANPRMNYGKDRGKEPHRPKEDFPWFWSWDEKSEDFLGGKDFDGARWNDLHYSLDTKRNARLRAQAKGSSK